MSNLSPFLFLWNTQNSFFLFFLTFQFLQIIIFFGLSTITNSVFFSPLVSQFPTKHSKQSSFQTFKKALDNSTLEYLGVDFLEYSKSAIHLHFDNSMCYAIFSVKKKKMIIYGTLLQSCQLRMINQLFNCNVLGLSWV